MLTCQVLFLFRLRYFLMILLHHALPVYRRYCRGSGCFVILSGLSRSYSQSRPRHPSIDNFTPCAQPPKITENPSYIANGSEKYFVIFWKKKNTRCILTEQMKTSKYWDKLTKLSPAMVWHQIPPPRYYISIIYIYMDHIPICASDPEHYFYPDFAYSPNNWISSGA